MSRLAGLAGLCLALAAVPAAAQQGGLKLFISPCGEPFRAHGTEPYPVVAWFQKADANHDGVVDRTEFRNDAKAFFNELDANHDGVLVSYEVMRYEHVIAPEIIGGAFQGAMLDRRPGFYLAQFTGTGLDDVPVEESDGSRLDQDGKPQKPNPMSMEGAAPYNLLGEPEPVSAADTDFDGRITLAEFLAAADRRFKKLDRNGDGKLTLDELPRTVQQEMAEGRGRRRPG